MFNSEMICGLWSGMLKPYKDHLEELRETFVLFDQIKTAAEAYEHTEKALRLLKLAGSQWPRQAAPVETGEELDRTVAAVPPKRQGKHQRRSGTGGNSQRSSTGDWSGSDLVRKPDGQLGCGFCGMSGPAHPATTAFENGGKTYPVQASGLPASHLEAERGKKDSRDQTNGNQFVGRGAGHCSMRQFGDTNRHGPGIASSAPVHTLPKVIDFCQRTQ